MSKLIRELIYNLRALKEGERISIKFRGNPPSLFPKRPEFAFRIYHEVNWNAYPFYRVIGGAPLE